jgi:hypothetical protein
LVAEDGAHSIGGELGRCAVGEEFEDEGYFGEGCEDTGYVEFEL